MLWYLSARSSTIWREWATSVVNVMCSVVPAAMRTRVRRLKMGSRTAPTVLVSGRPSITAMGLRKVCPRPTNRARSVSYWSLSPVWRSASTWAAQTVGSLCSRGRRCAIRPRTCGRYSVWTNRLENTGCAMSAARCASTISAYEVISMSRASKPLLVRLRWRISASSSGETMISRAHVMLPSVRVMRTRSSTKSTA